MTEQPCLHCKVWDLIIQDAPQGAGGAPIYDAQMIISNLLEIVAEVIASHPRATRRRLLDQVPRELRDQVAKAIAEGRVIEGGPATSAQGH